jgi:hypothetical protein
MTDSASRLSLKPVCEELDSFEGRVSDGVYAGAARSIRFLWIFHRLNSRCFGNIQFAGPLLGEVFY